MRKWLQVLVLGAVVALPALAWGASSAAAAAKDCCCPFCCPGQ